MDRHMSLASSPLPRIAPTDHRFELIVVGASRGGIQALSKLLSALPANFPIPIAIVQHRSIKPPNHLAAVLGKRTALRVKLAEEGDLIEAGTVYLAPPHAHLVLGCDRNLWLSDGSKIQFLRSSANPLFTSAARVLHGRVIGIVLTGGGQDAADGVKAIRNAGGFVIAQDKATSENHSMPSSAIATGRVDRVLPLEEIAPLPVELTSQTLPEANGLASAAG
jgi:two-component system chemotaxis response regulator CheB